MKLKDILKGLKFGGICNGDTEIKAIVCDSRKASENTAFVAITGFTCDGHLFANDAYRRGSRVFIAEHTLDLPSDAAVLVCDDTRSALSLVSANFFGHADRELKVVGVTGTNGKTTTTYMMADAFEKAGKKCGVIGTNGAVYCGKSEPTGNTTPEPYEFHRLLRAMADAGCEYVFVEVSSLGLKQHRVDDVHFFAGVFTNFSPDHVGGDEHSSVEEYLECKKKLFSLCDNAILNADDSQFDTFFNSCNCRIETFGVENSADCMAENITEEHKGLLYGVSFTLLLNSNRMEITVGIPGRFSVYNALAVFALADICSVEPDKISEALKTIKVDGRVEHIHLTGGAEAFIDYAHNGDGVRKLLEALGQYPHNKIISVFGCVGGRAQIRRREMGIASGELSDITILTSDDPGYEDPKTITAEVAGYVRSAGGLCIEIPDRKTAVRCALESAHEGDFVVFLGKGHEKFQKIKGQKVPFSDRTEVENFIKEHASV